jgi:small-conductance mechanosensitive channel
MATSAEQAAAGDVTSIVSGLEQVMDRFVSGVEARIQGFGRVPQEIEALHSSFAAGGTSAGALAVQIAVVVAVTAGVFILCRRQFSRPTAGLWRRILATIAAAVIAVAAGWLAERLLFVQGLSVRTLRLWVLITAMGLLALVGVRSLLMASRPAAHANVGHLANLARDLSIAIAWAMAGLALMTTLRLWSAGPGLLDLVGNLVVALPSFGLFALTVWRHRRTLAAIVAGSKPRSRWQGRLARIWPGLILGFLIVTFISLETAFTLGVPLPGATVLLTIVIVFLTPHLDAVIASSANRAMESPRVSIVGVAARQTARFAVLIIMLTMLGAIWATPLASGFGINLHSIAANAVHVALIAIAAAFLWSVVGTVTGRALHEGEASTHADHAIPRSRLGTLVPLLSGIAKAAILALAFLSVLVSLGVNVWPLITGLSVFGLAIGFGSQTLVKDVVSGLFFLVDDAFRMGEYIETSGAKGTVEKISVRSVTLRNARGPVATVPYGQMGKIQNFSRDYAIEKLAFRVHFDTDIELVRKLFKKIGQDIAVDPELAPDLIETFKSQGIADVEDGTLVIRGKFVAKPGKQSMIRRAVLKAVHQAFRENDIHAVPKPLTGDAAAQPAS